MYDAIFAKYKEYLINNSKYSPKIFKLNNNESTYFPTIVFSPSDYSEGYDTMKHIGISDKYYFTIEIYAMEKDGIAAQVIVEELRQLTNTFFGKKLNMRKTSDKPVPNIDTNIFRQVIYYQCEINNRGIITRF